MVLRKSPSSSATLYKEGTKKEGNDGHIWIVKANKNGVKRWVIYKKVNLITPQPRFLMIKNTIYLTNEKLFNYDKTLYEQKIYNLLSHNKKIFFEYIFIPFIVINKGNEVNRQKLTKKIFKEYNFDKKRYYSFIRYILPSDIGKDLSMDTNRKTNLITIKGNLDNNFTEKTIKLAFDDKKIIKNKSVYNFQKKIDHLMWEFYPSEGGLEGPGASDGYFGGELFFEDKNNDFFIELGLSLKSIKYYSWW